MKQYAVIGDPIIHSLSPLLHNEIYNQIGTLISYKKHQIKETGLSSFVSNNHIKFYNVTIPHKESILPYLKSLDTIAKEIGAVNCVMNQKGYNTDWLGFIYAMIYNNVDIKDKNCLIIGAGGAAKAIAYALIKSKPKSINVVNRSKDKKSKKSKSEDKKDSSSQKEEASTPSTGATALSADAPPEEFTNKFDKAKDKIKTPRANTEMALEVPDLTTEQKDTVKNSLACM